MITGFIFSNKGHRVSAKRQITVEGILKTFVLTVMLIVTVIIGAGYLYVNQAGGLRRLLETELSYLVDVGTATLGQARLNVTFSRHPIQLTATDIAINLKGEKIDLPSVDIRFGLSSILDGQPEMILLRGIKLDLVKKTHGWSGSPALLFLANMAKGKNQVGAVSGDLRIGHDRLRGVELIAIETDRLSLSHEVGASPKLIFEDIYIDATFGDDGKVFGSMRAHRLDQDELRTGNFSLSFEGWPGSKQIRLDLSASALQTSGISGYIDLLPAYLNKIGVLSGRVGLEVKDGILANLNADVRLSDGVLAVPGYSHKAAFDTARLVFAYRASSNSLTVSQAELNMSGKRRLSFDGVVRQLQAPVSTVRGVVEASNLSMQSIFERWPNSVASEIKEKLYKMISGGYFKFVTASFEGSFVSETNKWDLVKVDLDSQFSGARASLARGQYQRFVSTVGGKLGLTGFTGNTVEEVVVDLIMEDGSMLVTEFDEPVSFSSGRFKTVFRENKVIMESLALDMGGDGRLDLEGALEVDSNWELQDLKLNLHVPDMDVALFSALWPQWASPDTRNWVKENIPVGRITDAKLSLGADLGVPEGVKNLYDVKGDIKLRDAHLKWAKTASSLTNVDADIKWDNDELIADIIGGNVEDVVLQQASVLVAPVLARLNKNAVITVSAKGGVKTLLNLTREVGLVEYGILDFEEIEADGDVEFRIEAEVPFYQSIPFAEQVQLFDAAISNGSVSNLPNQTIVDNAKLKVSIAGSKSQISGTADIYGVPNNFNLILDNKTGQTSINGHISPSPLLAKNIASLSGLEIGGVTGGKFNYTGDLSLRDARVSMTIDLRGTKVQVPELGWTKLSPGNGRLSMVALIKNGQLDALQEIDLVAGNLSAYGELAFEKNGQFAAAFFERVAGPKNDIRDFIIRRTNNLSWALEGNAKLLNLDTVFNKSHSNFPGALSYNFSGDQIFVSDRVSLSGRLNGNRVNGSEGSASFQGTMFIDGDPWLDEANMKIHFSSNGNNVTATGLIGGGEANLVFRAIKGNRPELVIEAKNGGRILSGLGVIDTIRGGVLRLKSVFRDDEFRSYDTKISLEKFQVVEAPTALRAFSVLSLGGLYSLVEGDGTAFRQGEADLEIRGAKVNIKTITANGDAVGIAMTGAYNRANKKVNVRGNLVPANLISKALGSLPLLGDLITGVDKSGIFVTQFKITGTSDDMKTTVNPVSIVAPGLLRDFLSPNWLHKEQKHILGRDKKN